MDSLDPSFFTDSMALDEANAYQSPDAETGCVNPTATYASNFGLCDSQAPAEQTDYRTEPSPWTRDLHSQFGVLENEVQPQPFLQPGLQSPESSGEETKQQIQVAPMPVSQPSTRRASRAVSSSLPLRQVKEANPIKRRKVAFKKGMQDEAKTPEERLRRDKFLERNRVAASKCREKKKTYVLNLEVDHAKLEKDNIHLRQTYGELLGTVSALKHELMRHAECNDCNINAWISTEARKFAQTSANSLVFPQPFVGFNNAESSTTPEMSPQAQHQAMVPPFQHLQAMTLDTVGPPAEPQAALAYANQGSLYPSPTEEAFAPQGVSPVLKTEPGINYDHMPDSMFNSDGSNFNGM
ncbi:hypothetical protein N0V88_001311 [Collariella sp. IMI 366227]|nr:hypothetical protein N0V88_001311 [Collariella sp. IMI 366227]